MAGIGADFVFDFLGDGGILFQKQFGVFASLTELFAFVGEPGAGFFNDACFDAEVNQFAGFGNAFAIHDVKIDDFERRSNFVFDNFDAGLAADNVFLIFNGTDAANVDANRGIEFQRVAAGCGFGVAEHDADFHANLVDEDNQRDLVDAIDTEDCTPSHAQTIKMRKFFDEGKLSSDVITSIMQEEKPNQKEKIVIPNKTVEKYIPKSIPAEKRQDYVCKALEHYGKYLQKMRDRESR